MRAFASLDEAAQTLTAADAFVLALPVSAILAQRLRLPGAAPDELRDMVRIQLEKALPFPAEELTSDFEVLVQTENECVVSAIAVQNQRLAEMAGPLLARDAIPQAVTVYAAQRLATHARNGCALFIYPENGALVAAIAEGGKLSLARNIALAAPLELELPQLAMGAELQGINASFENVLLDEKCYDLRDTIDRTLGVTSEIVGLEMPPAPTALNLLPEEWRERRRRGERLGIWRQRIIWAAGIYAAIIALFLLQFAYLKFRMHQLDRQIARDESKTTFVKASAAKWKILAPAVDPQFYPIEIILHLFESLPSPDVRITAYNQSARQLSVEGEASSAALAYQFADKVKKNSGLQNFIFDMQAPRLLPNDHAQFRLEGRPR
ncbi:MAG: hypothetical protein M3R59_01510 [Verrucomicrobiota bacterium]|nr:hypothetical protein [Verrucomicrobiota bacterium]